MERSSEDQLKLGLLNVTLVGLFLGLGLHFSDQAAAARVT